MPSLCCLHLDGDELLRVLDLGVKLHPGNSADGVLRRVLLSQQLEREALGSLDGKPNKTNNLWISFEAIGFGGDEGVDYNDDEETEVCEVSSEELEQFAFQNRKPSPDRKPIKNITISD